MATLHTLNGIVNVSSNGISILHCKVGEIQQVFEELFKIVPKDTPVRNLKQVLIQKIIGDENGYKT